jgi:hypothetical protein
VCCGRCAGGGGAKRVEAAGVTVRPMTPSGIEPATFRPTLIWRRPVTLAIYIHLLNATKRIVSSSAEEI